MEIDRRTGNIAIESFILGNDAHNWEHEFIKDDAVPYCDIDGHKICSPVFGTIINEHDDMMVRGKNEHEAGHARLTPANKDPKWSNLKGMIVNILEDLRIEHSISKLSPMIAKDLIGMNQELNRSLNLKFSQENNMKPINEALLAMSFRENGLYIGWNLTEAAQRYIDAAYDEFKKWKDIENIDDKRGFYEIEKIADKVIEKLEEAKEIENQKNNNSDSNSDNQKNSNSDKKENNSGNSSDSDEKGDQNSMDNSDSNNSSDSDNEEENDNKSGNNESSDSDEDDEDENEKSGNGNSDSADEDDEDEKEEDSDDDSDSKNNSNNNSSDSNSDSDNKDQSESNSSMDSNNEDKAPQDDVNGDGEESKIIKQEHNLEEDFSNDDVVKEELEKKMKEIMKNSQEISAGYTSFTGNDEVVEARENKDSYEYARKEISSIVGQLSNYTEDAIKALSRVQFQRNLEHGKIDHRKLVGLSKSLTKKVFYKTKNGIDLNTAVTIMIDESGSIGSMCRQLRSIAIAFSEVFTKLNIRFEVLGFTTGYNTNIEPPKGVTRTVPIKIIEHKTYNETYQKAKYKLGSITSESCNVDGESLLFAYKRIAKERVNRRIIFVLSDGLPNQGYNGRSICQHLRDSIKFIRKNGVEVYGFGIGTNEPQYYYGKENFLYLRGISELGTSFFKRFREIIAK